MPSNNSRHSHGIFHHLRSASPWTCPTIWALHNESSTARSLAKVDEVSDRPSTPSSLPMNRERHCQMMNTTQRRGFRPAGLPPKDENRRSLYRFHSARRADDQAPSAGERTWPLVADQTSSGRLHDAPMAEPSFQELPKNRFSLTGLSSADSIRHDQDQLHTIIPRSNRIDEIQSRRQVQKHQTSSNAASTITVPPASLHAMTASLAYRLSRPLSRALRLRLRF